MEEVKKQRKEGEMDFGELIKNKDLDKKERCKKIRESRYSKWLDENSWIKGNSKI